ncbi:MAG: type IV secretory system conjugative DNA transfer family protein [Aestuariivirga sp.]
MMSGLSARRLVVPALTALLVTAAAAILWTLLYAAITAIAFKDLGLLRTVTEHDPTASLTHLRYYWSDARVPRHALIAAAATVVMLGGLTVSAWLIRPPSTFGDARFASSGEITRANLHARTGLILGRRGGLLLRHDAPGHVLVEGPTRSGKGQGFVEPNLLTWEGSLICLDPKQENFKATAAARLARGDACFLFAPGSTRSHAYNPLDLVRRGPQMATDLANLAAFLIPEPRGEGAFWASSARNLFAASLGYVLETPLAAEARHIGAVLALFSTGKDIAEALQVIVKTEAAHLSSFIVDQFNQFVPMPEKTRGSVVAHLIDALKPWTNPLVVAATARSDFNLRELRETPMAIYIGAPVADLESYRPLIRVLVQQAHDQLMRDLPQTDDALPVLIMLDEFPTLQRMEAIVAKLPVSAGYGVRMAIVVQALSQLDELYGRATRDTILANTDLKLFVGTNDQATADYISEALGTRTALSRTVSGARSQNPFAPRSTTRAEVATRLMRPEQVRELDKRKAILLARGERPVLLEKVVAHRDRMLIKLKRKGRDALLSVPELKPARQSSPFASLQAAREHPPTPSTFTARRPDPRQGELALKPEVEGDKDRSAHEQPNDPPPAPAATDAGPDKAVERPKADRAAVAMDDEAKLKVFLDRAADDMPEDRASRLKQSTDVFLVLSRRFREEAAGA